MIFAPTPLAGAFLLEMERHQDERGFFARLFCHREFAAHGLNARVAQSSISFSRKKGTLRGMHWQAAPHQEVKLVTCLRGSIYDVIVDLRSDSPHFLEHFAVELSASNRRLLYIPEGFAHGFQTLEDDSEVFYQMSEFFAPEHACGARWDDPAFGIPWPADDRTIIDRDRNYPPFSVAAGVRP